MTESDLESYIKQIKKIAVRRRNPSVFLQFASFSTEMENMLIGKQKNLIRYMKTTIFYASQA